jgi:uncharacterized membrane protein
VTLRPDVLLAILGMALATYAMRAGGYALLRVSKPNRFAQNMLQHLPGCIFVAFIAPALVEGGPLQWAAGAATVAIMAATRSYLAAIAGGVATLSLLGWWWTPALP